MTPCPVCGKPVDPLRAPAVSVRDGKVVAFCSKECRAQAETQPVRIQPTKVVRLPSEDAPIVGRTATADKLRTPSTGVPSSGVPKSTADLDSGPVIEIVREPSRPVVVEPTKKRKRSDSSIQIADTGRLDDYIVTDGGGRGRILLAVFLLGLLVGGGIAAYKLGYLDGLLNKKPARAAPGDAAVAPVFDDAPPAPAITPDAALAKAKSVLEAQLKSDSPRVQRVAASALARTGDKAAFDLLAKSIATESSDVAKLDMAYALARSGDKFGTDALVVMLGSGKRDPKLEAGRRLALLGDKRAVNALGSYLSVDQLRLGTAEQLAYLADPKALPDDKARATIALGHAGRTDVAPALHELLTDDRQNAFAAQALANLHDEAARPVLVSQLGIPSLRVKSARALRRLAPDADVSALLPPLVAALDSNKDTEQVQIAEAVLLLAGPAAWSEHE
ncbi:MAG TPA: hypothetical protein VMZ53_31340 [Kofleriaceae bacterium]|nr:hypothetical protein [Kofleriaceae bacterium]